MKKLILTLASIAMIGCSSIPEAVPNPQQEKVFRNLGIPVRFLNYEKKEFTRNVKEFSGRLYGIVDYLDSKGKVEVREVYNVISEDDEGYNVETKPFRYLFEMNKLNGFQDDEILTDDRKDGLNGNERWYEIRVVKMNHQTI